MKKPRSLKPVHIEELSPGEFLRFWISSPCTKMGSVAQVWNTPDGPVYHCCNGEHPLAVECDVQGFLMGIERLEQ